VPNGNLNATGTTPAAADLTPLGVPKQSWNAGLYLVDTLNYLAPVGADPDADLTTWYRADMAGEPESSVDRYALEQLQTYRSAAGIPAAVGGPAPTVIQSGWTDTLFPVTEALHFAAQAKAANPHATLLMLFDDVGHGWAGDKPADVAYNATTGIGFLNAVMLHHAQPTTGVIAVPQTCPHTAPSGSRLTGATLASLAHGEVTLSGADTQTVTSGGGAPTVAAALDPVTGTLCQNLSAAAEPGTATYKKPVASHPEQLIGAVTVHAHLAVTGQWPEVVARLWDVAPGGATRQIVAMGVYRPHVNQGAAVTASSTGSTDATITLNPNDYTFAPGHTIELELVGSNAPYFRASNGTFTIGVSDLTATLPVR
jgi:hypothetical protein